MRTGASSLRGRFRNYRYNSLMSRAFRIIFVGVALPLMIMIVATYAFSQNILTREVEVANMRALDTVEAIVNTLFEDVYTASKRIGLDSDISAILKMPAPESYADFERVWRAIGKLELNRKGSFVDSIYLYILGSDYLITSFDYASRMEFAPDRGILNDMDSPPSRDVYCVRREMQSPFNAKPIPVLTVFRSVNSSGNRGVVAVNIQESTLVNLLADTGRDSGGGNVILIDETGSIIYDMHGAMSGLDADSAFGEDAARAMRDSGRGSFMPNDTGERAMATYTHLACNGWALVKVVPYHAYAGSLNALGAFVLGSLAMGLIISLIVAAALGERLHRPIEEIVRFIDRADESGAPVGNDELNYILMHLISLYDENKLLERERLDRFAALRRAQAHALQVQITPHFLHNTLQAIGWQVLKATGDEDTPALQGLVMLSDMARTAMEDTGNLVPLREELDYIEKYIALHRLRYRDALKYEWRVPDELLSALVPRVSLQPLVENAIEHALESRDGRGSIQIEGRLDEGILILDVLDDGVGMAEAEIARLNASFLSGGETFVRHIGLRNVNLRIRLIFGEAYHLTIYSREEGGLRVRVRLPYYTELSSTAS